jgi:hypothetical protein
MLYIQLSKSSTEKKIDKIMGRNNGGQMKTGKGEQKIHNPEPEIIKRG